jgi:AraC-like DNA-binding protein
LKNGKPDIYSFCDIVNQDRRAMDLWMTKFQVCQGPEEFPRPDCAAESLKDSPAYHCEGKHRAREPHCLLLLTTEGRGVFRDRDGEHSLGPGRCFICKINDPDTAYYYPEDGREPWRFLWFTFSGAAGRIIVDGITGRYGGVMEPGAGSPLRAKMTALKKHAGQILWRKPFAGMSLVTELLSCACAGAETRSMSSAGAVLAQKAQRFIIENLESGADAAGTAERLGVSRERLSRVFRENASVTVLDFINAQKILRAKHYLHESGMSCKEISDRLGYGSQTNFSRAFKAATGMTPGGHKRSGDFLFF